MTGKLQRVLDAGARVVTGTGKFDRGLSSLRNYIGSVFPNESRLSLAS